MNVYVHFPFCRGKCAYCALHSRAGSTPEQRRAYCAGLVTELEKLPTVPDTVYFGGGTPTLCDLAPVLGALRGPVPELTVEIHPLDATPSVLAALRAGGVNRVSMGVQSFDEIALAAMGRRHTAAQAEAGFRALRVHGFTNAGIDLIAGWPGTSIDSWRNTLERALALEPDHVSVYSLIHEPQTRLDLEVRRGRWTLPSDDVACAQLDLARSQLTEAGLSRYEISNYAKPGFECRHNLAVWRGEDYWGFGEGSCGRRGLTRTESGRVTETLTPERDALERTLFALRTREGLDLERVARLWPVLKPRLPDWRETLECFKRQGLLVDAYRLTPRGAEVCDSILAELV